MTSRGSDSGPPRRGGLFVTFEGLEGSGKSTQIAWLERELTAAGFAVRVTREPGGTALGRQLRSVLLAREGAPMAPLVELLLYTADRAQHVTEVVRPALERGEVVLSDRYLDATLAYQGHARGLGFEAVLRLHERSPLDLRPDRTLLLDMDPESALARARGRNEARGLSEVEGRFEEEALDFHRAVRAGYLRLAEDDPARYRVVRAEGAPDEVGARVREALADLFPVLAPGGRR